MASRRKPVSLDTKLQVIDQVDKKVKATTQIDKEYGVPYSTLSKWLKNKDSLRKTHGNLFAKLSIYLQSLPDTQQIFSCKIMKENVEIKDEINCWFSSSNQRLGTHLLRVLIK